MAKREMFYTVEDAGDQKFSFLTAFAHHEPVEILGEMRTWGDLDAEWAAADAAEDYWHNHDGYESRWPLLFTLYATEDGQAVATVKVDQEAEPTFIGWVQSPIKAEA